jgi:hypothetical protein
MKAWGQTAGNGPVIHRPDAGDEVVVIDSRGGTRSHAQGTTRPKPLMLQVKMAFSTGRAGLYYYHQSEKKTS